MGAIQNFITNNKSPSIFTNIVMFISFIILIYILVQLIIVLNKPNLLYYSYDIEPINVKTIKFKSLTKDGTSVEDIPELPKLTNGREFTYSFWIYINSILSDDSNKDKYAFVFARGEDGKLQNSNPIVYFNKNSNNLIIKLKTEHTNSDEFVSMMNNINIDKIHCDNCNYATFNLNYIPLQRWVNVIINVDNTLADIYLDGNIVHSRLVNQIYKNEIYNNDDIKEEGCDLQPSEECNDLANKINITEGDIKIGYTNNYPAFNGYISNIQFFNYSIKSPSDIKNIYERGPVTSHNVLQKLGLPEFGFDIKRWPLYKIKGIEDEDSN